MTEEERFEHLLDLADVGPEDRPAARAQLSAALGQARLRPLPARPTALALSISQVLGAGVVGGDVNKPIDEIRKRAEALLHEMRALRNHPYSHVSFWAQDEFGPQGERQTRRIDPSQPLDIETGLERGGIIETLQSIVKAAEDAKRSRPASRPKDRRKQKVVDLAALFWVRATHAPISSTPDGKFYTFAEAFLEAATGQRGVERAVKIAVRKLDESRAEL